jgi:hypothetical protein
LLVQHYTKPRPTAEVVIVKKEEQPKVEDEGRACEGEETEGVVEGRADKGERIPMLVE